MNKLLLSPHSLPFEAQKALWFIFRNEEILLHVISDIIKIPESLDIGMNLSIQQSLYIGMHNDIHCFAADAQSLQTPLPPNMEFQHIRRAYFSLKDEKLFMVVSRALEILYWNQRTQFCGSCGQKTEPHKTEYAKLCPNCNTMFFPQISPAILALVWRDDEILLGHSPHFLPGVYSILAGFVEPGESIEQSLMREIKEEVNITVKHLTYFSSQPWPFPSNLMIGFFAEYESGEIEINKTELEDAQWFSIKNLPTLPNQMSLSRRMIDAFVASRIH